jgi:Tol biopolymer transport system component
VIGNVWVADTARGFPTQITFGTGMSGGVVWSPDSKRVVYLSSSKRNAIVEKNANGSGDERVLLTVESTSTYPTSWSPDDRFILYDRNEGSQANRHIMVLPLDGTTKPFRFIETSAEELDGQFSPNGQWVAYTSNETGTGEIYVQPFSKSAGGKWRVSQGGAQAPQWRSDGMELYYIRQDGTLMAVDVSKSTAKEFQAGATTPLFKVPLGGGTGSYNAAADGRRFLVGLSVTNAAKRRDETPFTVILNWETLLRK